MSTTSTPCSQCSSTTNGPLMPMYNPKDSTTVLFNLCQLCYCCYFVCYNELLLRPNSERRGVCCTYDLMSYTDLKSFATGIGTLINTTITANKIKADARYAETVVLQNAYNSLLAKLKTSLISSSVTTMNPVPVNQNP